MHHRKQLNEKGRQNEKNTQQFYEIFCKDKQTNRKQLNEKGRQNEKNTSSSVRFFLKDKQTKLRGSIYLQTQVFSLPTYDQSLPAVKATSCVCSG